MAKFDTHIELTELVNVSESRAFQQFLDERKQRLQEEVNKFVKQQDMIEAYGALSKLNDIVKTMDMLKQRIFDLRKEQ
jgi:predicted house-cleaning noncanonical NTP pyrophosphatase (MazG superfamily)